MVHLFIPDAKVSQHPQQHTQHTSYSPHKVAAPSFQLNEVSPAQWFKSTPLHHTRPHAPAEVPHLPQPYQAAVNTQPEAQQHQPAAWHHPHLHTAARCCFTRVES
eukprot:GHRQ01034945.1.p3 GENE.GHRQ01034945.1~~GHRQ01034945.1.p3  ORF type:complete len:105 (-),score=25.67 GHRQ01034945.1:26-340(-)